MNSIQRAMHKSEMIGALVKASAGGSPFFAGTGSTVALGIGSAQMNHAKEQERHNSGWTHAAIRVVANRIAGQPIRVAKRTTPAPNEPKSRLRVLSRVWAKGAPTFVKQAANRLEPLDTHPLLTAIENPNPYLTGHGLLYVTVFQLELTGVSHWWLRDADGGGLNTGLEIWPLPSSWIKPVQEGSDPFHHYTVTPPGMSSGFDIPGDEVARIHYPDPADPVCGAFSPLQANSVAVVTDESVQQTQLHHFLNGAAPGVAIIMGRQPDVNGNPGERPVLNKDQRAQIMLAYVCGSYSRFGNVVCHRNQVDEDFMLARLVPAVQAYCRELLDDVRATIAQEIATTEGVGQDDLDRLRREITALSTKIERGGSNLLVLDASADPELFAQLRKTLGEWSAERKRKVAELDGLERGTVVRDLTQAGREAETILWNLCESLDNKDRDNLRAVIRESVLSVDLFFEHFARGKWTMSRYLRGKVTFRPQALGLSNSVITAN